MDPTYIEPHLQQCDLCTKSLCKCIVDKVRSDVPDIVPAGSMGEGVRSNTTYEEGDLLGELVGELVPIGTFEDGWACEMARDDLSDEGELKTVCQVYPRFMGNWARKANHSCEYNVQFVDRRISGRWRVMVEAMVEIAPGDDILINYGDNFWAAGVAECLYGSARCVSKGDPRDTE